MGPIKFFQHDLIGYREEHQHTIDPIYGFGMVTLTVDAAFPDWPSEVATDPKYSYYPQRYNPSLFKCIWNNQYHMTQATMQPRPTEGDTAPSKNPCTDKALCKR